MGPDLHELVSSHDELVQHFLIGIGQADVAVVRQFAADLLARELDPEQLSDFWWSMPATTVFYDGRDVRTFLTALHEVLSKPPYSNGVD